MRLCISFLWFIIVELVNIYSKLTPFNLKTKVIKTTVAVVLSLSYVWLFCNSMNCSSPSSSVHEVSQVRIWEWVDIFFSGGSSWLRDQTHISCLGRQIIAESPGNFTVAVGKVYLNPHHVLMLLQSSLLMRCNLILFTNPIRKVSLLLSSFHEWETRGWIGRLRNLLKVL